MHFTESVVICLRCRAPTVAHCPPGRHLEPDQCVECHAPLAPAQPFIWPVPDLGKVSPDAESMEERYWRILDDLRAR